MLKFNQPILASLAADRRQSLLIGCAAVLHVGLTAAGLPGWQCPFRAVFGIPCPGCGLGTAASQMLKGDLMGGLQTHAFAPIYAAGILVVVLSVILPDRQRKTWVDAIARLEQKTGLVAILLIGSFVYWGLRLL